MAKSKVYKYGTEAGLITNLGKYQLAQQDELDFIEEMKVFPQSNPCNIYFICSRPKVVFNPNIKIIKEHSIIIETKNLSNEQRIPFEIPLKEEHFNVKIDIPYPYSKLILINGNGDKLLEIKATALLDTVQQLHKKLKILYIGKSIDSKGNSIPLNRLKKHDTLKDIYFDVMSTNPNEEIWIFLASFVQKNFLTFNGFDNLDKSYEKEDESRFMNYLYNGFKISYRQKISYIEAALINYFKPKYNEKFKNCFPSNSHTSYSDCYNLDLNGVCIELFTGDLGYYLYSETQSPSLYHKKEYYFTNDNDRKRLFDFADISR